MFVAPVLNFRSDRYVICPCVTPCIYYFSAFTLATEVRQSKHGKVFLQKDNAYVGPETYSRR